MRQLLKELNLEVLLLFRGIDIKNWENECDCLFEGQDFENILEVTDEVLSFSQRVFLRSWVTEADQSIQ